MKQFLSKPYRWAFIFTLLLIGSFIFALLNIFVIPKSIQPVTTVAAKQSENTAQAEEVSKSSTQSEAIITDNSYEDDNIKITIETLQKYDSTIYVADIQLSDASYLKTALAGNVYGRNIKETTSAIAEESDAIFAVNGDYYGFRDYGYVLRNGVLYRDTARKSGDDEALVIDNAGDFSIINESQTSTEALDCDNIWQILSFGPALVKDSKVIVDSNSEVSQSMNSNPRTAFGQISSLHYIVIVSDGRTDASAGLSLLELAQEFEDRGCTTAYNLDGGGSATMYFNGAIVNHPTDGRHAGEREVSDIVYFGY